MDRHYKGNISRQQAEQLLASRGTVVGDFVVRDTTKQQGRYVITFVYGQPQATQMGHNMVWATSRGFYIMDVKSFFQTMDELLDYLAQQVVPGFTVKLQVAPPAPAPVLAPGKPKRNAYDEMEMPWSGPKHEYEEIEFKDPKAQTTQAVLQADEYEVIDVVSARKAYEATRSLRHQPNPTASPAPRLPAATETKPPQINRTRKPTITTHSASPTTAPQPAPLSQPSSASSSPQQPSRQPVQPATHRATPAGSTSAPVAIMAEYATVDELRSGQSSAAVAPKTDAYSQLKTMGVPKSLRDASWQVGGSPSAHQQSSNGAMDDDFEDLDLDALAATLVLDGDDF
ncbi:uncharacterized protein MONBRDRAFT_5748 [Monosiga brevicollis MX1]|uniref:SH2 domain-containing protein n=1 Tax=Monosiga brevicollis TaxID=81824 RepID=A9USC2_MONBE|nr:uncharacterized protein MONBRDRAFT_5748 [Monosiga brevicollis MX1]EDQ91755.1 predicted protein [Monosiga brevicollis MX1]|eukprot:XP_001743041.1 hypothetical protein [Monosiga brevicollis MX1]